VILAMFCASARSSLRLASKASGSVTTSGVIGVVRISFFLDVFSALACYVHERRGFHPFIKLQAPALRWFRRPTGTNPWQGLRMDWIRDSCSRRSLL
jgi:hypothetical protein